MTDEEKLIDLIKRVSEDIEHEEIGMDGLSPEHQELGEAICSCLRQGQEVVRFTASLADGDLTMPVPNRRNYMAGPIKDLYYKLKHFEWQTHQIAKGDYSQRVDFMGSFAESFNYMTEELCRREDTIKEQAEEKVQLLETQKHRLEQQMERQLVHYHAYRDYVDSFISFRENYKKMMGDVFALFNAGKYEEGRLLVAKINDAMGSDVVINKQFSNQDFVNAALIEISATCKARGIPFDANVWISRDFHLAPGMSLELLNNLQELVMTLLEMPSHVGQTLSIQGSEKQSWLSLVILYHFDSGLCPADTSVEFQTCVGCITELAAKADGMFDVQCIRAEHTIHITLHLPE